jgi:hypothetical protein
MLVSCQPIFHPCPMPCLCRHHAFDAWQKKHLSQELLLTVGVLSPGGMILAENQRNTYHVNQTVLDFPSLGFTALGQCSRLLLTSWRGQGRCRIESLLINLDICSLAEPEYPGSVGPRISRSKARPVSPHGLFLPKFNRFILGDPPGQATTWDVKLGSHVRTGRKGNATTCESWETWLHEIEHVINGWYLLLPCGIAPPHYGSQR